MEDLPPLEPLEKRIIEYLVEKECYFVRLTDKKDLYKCPYSFNTLHELEINTKESRRSGSDLKLLGKFNVKLGNMIRFDFYGRKNKKDAMKLCKDLKKKFDLIMTCALVSEKDRIYGE
jgi:hypothetical protein